MHEFAITKELVKVARETAQKEQIQNVTKIVVELGLLTTYEEESLQYYFKALQPKEDALKDATLVVEENEGNEIKITSIAGEK